MSTFSPACLIIIMCECVYQWPRVHSSSVFLLYCVYACAVAVAAVYSSMADCSKYTVEEAGFDISALKTSLIQYFRCRNRASDHCSLPPRVTELRQNRTLLKPGIHRKWTQTAAVGFSVRK